MKKILFDTDLIGDDLLTLIAIGKEPRVKVIGVTAYGRRIGGLRRAKIALKVANSVGIQDLDIVPGADCPLIREARAGCMHCDHVIDRFMESSDPKDLYKDNGNKILSNIHAAQYIVDKIHEFPGELTILCTGPLTNLALALRLDSSIANDVNEIFIMGGADRVSGNTTPYAESNFCNDPEAAEIVFKKFDRITMVGLDVTLQTAIDESNVSKLGSFPLSLFLKKLVESCCDAHRERDQGYRMPLHDILAFYSLVDPGIIGTEVCEVKIETKSPIAFGMSVCDRGSERRTHKVAVSVDREKVVEKFQNLVNNLFITDIPKGDDRDD